MDEAQELDVFVHRKEKYAFRCGERRVSWRALKLAITLVASLLILSIVVWRAVRKEKDFWSTLVDIVIAVAAILTPSW